MPKKTIVLASLLALGFAFQQPGFADPPPSGPGADPRPPAQKPGLMSRFASLFDGLDTSRPENRHVFVIGGTSSPPDPASASVPASTVATPASTTQLHGHGFTLKSGFEADDGQKPAEQAAHPPR